MSRVLKTKGNKITQKYKADTHKGMDIVGTGSTLDYIVAHSAGTVVGVRADYKTTDKTGNSYGNYVKIKHSNGMYTLYAHMKYNSVTVKVGDKVSKGQVIGYMGSTGHSTGAHLHWEVRNDKDVRIDPTAYLDTDLPNNEVKPTPAPTPAPNNSGALKVGDRVRIVGKGNGSSLGAGKTAFGIGWEREILKVWEGRKFPYQVGIKNKGTTGFYTADALKKI